MPEKYSIRRIKSLLIFVNKYGISTDFHINAPSVIKRHFSLAVGVFILLALNVLMTLDMNFYSELRTTLLAKTSQVKVCIVPGQGNTI